MKCIKWIISVLLLALLLVVVSCTFDILEKNFLSSYSCTIHPTMQWRVKAVTHTGISAPVKTYKVFGKDVLFLYVDGYDNNHLPSIMSGWFAVDCSNKREGVIVLASPMIMEGGLLSLPVRKGEKGTRVEYGFDLLDDKDDIWHLSYTNKSVVFSNHVFSVSATRRGLFSRKTDEVHRHTGDNLGK